MTLIERRGIHLPRATMKRMGRRRGEAGARGAGRSDHAMTGGRRGRSTTTQRHLLLELLLHGCTFIGLGR
jgi:hypothetical protein